VFGGATPAQTPQFSLNRVTSNIYYFRAAKLFSTAIRMDAYYTIINDVPMNDASLHPGDVALYDHPVGL
jgi:hypothetical protein